MYSFGADFFNVLGYRVNGPNGYKQLVPKEIELLQGQNVIQIAASEYRGIALTKDGRALFWGVSLGDIPSEMPGLKGRIIKKVATGPHFSIVLDDDGVLLSLAHYFYDGGIWGSHENPYIPLNYSHLNYDDYVVDMSIGEEHILILTKNKSVISYGFNPRFPEWKYLGYETEDPHKPQKIVSLENKNIIKIAAGNRFSAVLSEKGDVWWFGDPLDGISNEGSTYLPVKLKATESVKIIDIKAGPYSFFPLDDQGTMHSFGGLNITINSEYCEIYYPHKITGIRFDHWTKETHSFHSKEIKDVVFMMLLIQKYYIKPKVPKPVMFLLLKFLTQN